MAGMGVSGVKREKMPRPTTVRVMPAVAMMRGWRWSANRPARGDSNTWQMGLGDHHDAGALGRQPP